MIVPLGRVVGSKIRNGQEIPKVYDGWLDGDIFILNTGNIPYYEYVSGRLILRGELRGIKGDNLFKFPFEMITLTKEEIYDEIPNATTPEPTWNDIMATLFMLYENKLTSDNTVYLTYDNKTFLIAKQDNTDNHYTIIDHGNSIIDYYHSTYNPTYTVYDTKTYEYTLKLTYTEKEIYKTIYTKRILERGTTISKELVMTELLPPGVYSATGYYIDSDGNMKNIYTINHDGHDIILNNEDSTRREEYDYMCEIF